MVYRYRRPPKPPLKPLQVRARFLSLRLKDICPFCGGALLVRRGVRRQAACELCRHAVRFEEIAA